MARPSGKEGMNHGAREDTGLGADAPGPAGQSGGRGLRSGESAGQHQEQLKLLSDHRRHLLDCLHREERRIDCLDYLVYQLEKRRAGEL